MDLTLLYTIGGSPWLNLVNTLNKVGGRSTDLLAEPDTVRNWLLANGLWLSPRREPALEEIVALAKELASLRELACKLLESLRAGQGGWSSPAGEKLRETASRLTLGVRWLRSSESEAWTSLDYEGRSTIDHAVYGIIRSIADTLAAYPLERIRACEHEDCVLQFVDTSKAGKRRWCSMEMCGNRHKAAEFYAKRRMKGRPQTPSSPS